MLVKNSRYARKADKALLFILEHTEKRCAYCGEIYGAGLGVPVGDIVRHMKDKHPEKINMKEAELYIKIFS